MESLQRFSEDIRQLFQSYDQDDEKRMKVKMISMSNGGFFVFPAISKNSFKFFGYLFCRNVCESKCIFALCRWNRYFFYCEKHRLYDPR